jgi:hypothetical protein
MCANRIGCSEAPGPLITPCHRVLTTQPPQICIRGGLDWAVTRDAIWRNAGLGFSSVQRVKRVSDPP